MLWLSGVFKGAFRVVGIGMDFRIGIGFCHLDFGIGIRMRIGICEFRNRRVFRNSVVHLELGIRIGIGIGIWNKNRNWILDTI